MRKLDTRQGVVAAKLSSDMERHAQVQSGQGNDAMSLLSGTCSSVRALDPDIGANWTADFDDGPDWAYSYDR